MSKNRNYGAFYKKDKDPAEVSYENETKEVAVTEETVEAPVETDKEAEPEMEEAPKKSDKAIVTGAPRVNMRFKPNKAGQVINVLSEKAEVKIIDTTNEEWWKVTYKGITGYMMAQFLKEV